MAIAQNENDPTSELWPLDWPKRLLNGAAESRRHQVLLAPEFSSTALTKWYTRIVELVFWKKDPSIFSVAFGRRSKSIHPVAGYILLSPVIAVAALFWS